MHGLLKRLQSVINIRTDFTEQAYGLHTHFLDIVKGISDVVGQLFLSTYCLFYDQLGTNRDDSEDGSWSAARPQNENTGQEFHFGGTGFSDFFEQYFSGGSRYGFSPDERAGKVHARRHVPQPYRGSDIEGDILVTLGEAMHGTLRPISLQIVNRETGQAETRSFKIRIPPGAIDGRRIRVAGKGEPGHGGGSAGDLFLRVRHAAHPDFSSRDSDIYRELDVAPWEAVLGAEVVVSTLDGAIKLRIPATAEKAVKGLKKPGIQLKRHSTNPFLQNAISWTDKSPRERVHLRARELTLLAGHASLDVTQEDYEQAKREVTGETILSRQNLILDAVA